MCLTAEVDADPMRRCRAVPEAQGGKKIAAFDLVRRAQGGHLLGQRSRADQAPAQRATPPTATLCEPGATTKPMMHKSLAGWYLGACQVQGAVCGGRGRLEVFQQARALHGGRKGEGGEMYCVISVTRSSPPIALLLALQVPSKIQELVEDGYQIVIFSYVDS